MKKIILILAIIIIPLVYIKYNQDENIVIPNNSIRIRIIANSNSIEDQYIKIKVRENVQVYLESILKEATSKEEVEKIIKNNLLEVDKTINNCLKEVNSNIDYKINFGNNYFPQKEYKGIIYDEGYYESLVITLGKGEGDNWWCVLFPPLCLMNTEENISDVEYKLFVLEVIDKYK